MTSIAQLISSVVMGSGMVFPDHRFFTPTKKFLDILWEYRNYHFWDIGAGNGATAHDIRREGMDCRAIDIIPRDSAHPVEMINALDVDWEELGGIQLVCRPNHSGWFGELLEKSYLGDAFPLVYVGLRRNISVDITENQYGAADLVIDGMGEEGEVAIFWGPSRFWQKLINMGEGVACPYEYEELVDE